MRKIYIVVAMMLIAGMTFSQTFNVGSVSSKKMTLPKHEAGKNPTDTTGCGVLAQSTFIPVFAPGGQVFLYGNQGGGYVFGVNNINGTSIKKLSQGYSCLTSNTLGVCGVTMLFCGKTGVSGDPTSKLTFSICNKPDSIPTNQIGTVTGDLLFTDCDTNFLTFNTVMFPSVIPITAADFAIVCSFANIKTDTVGFVCDADGEGTGWAAFQYGTTWWTYKHGYGLNSNIGLFAIVDINFVGINDSYFFQGAKMTINQNPSRDNLSIDYMVENDSKVNFELISLSGKSVLKIDEGFKQKGNVNSINADISNLACGTYLCSLSSNGQRLIKKVVIE